MLNASILINKKETVLYEATVQHLDSSSEIVQQYNSITGSYNGAFPVFFSGSSPNMLIGYSIWKLLGMVVEMNQSSTEHSNRSKLWMIAAALL